MFQTFKNAWKTPDLKKKILFTLMILLLYRIGANLFVPFVDTETIGLFANQMGGIFQFVSMFSGLAFDKATFFALSVSPYITASIVMQLLTIAIPALERLAKDGGEEGKQKINNYTRWVTVGLALITAYGYVKVLERGYNGVSYLTISKGEGAYYYFGMVVLVASFCAGAAVIMWLAEKINDYGIGNGISMILFANIISGAARRVEELIQMISSKEDAWGYVLGSLEVVLSLALALAAIGFIVWFTNSERRILIRYAKITRGRKMYGGGVQNLPLKMDMAGVMPVIFASSIVSIPATIAGFMSTNGFTKWVETWFAPTSPVYIVLFVILIFLFSYFYIAISFNPVEVSNNIRSNGGSIPGHRPEDMAPTIKKILDRVTLMGAVFLAIISGVPMIVGAFVSFSSIAFGGTSLLIVVGVALETYRDLEAQLAMRSYKGKGFLG